jgi:hypothetical protein
MVPLFFVFGAMGGAGALPGLSRRAVLGFPAAGLKGGDETGNVMGSANPFGSGKHAGSASFGWLEQTEGTKKEASPYGGFGLRRPSRFGGEDVKFEDGRLPAAAAGSPCDLICVTVSSMHEMGKLGFECRRANERVSVSAICRAHSHHESDRLHV